MDQLQKNRLIAFLFLGLLVACVGFSQLFAQERTIQLVQNQAEFVTVDLDSSTSQTIYVSFPPTRGLNSELRGTVGTTALSLQQPDYMGSGDVCITIIPDTVTIEESDSLYGYIMPYSYNKTKNAWYVCEVETTFLVFDTRATWAQTTVDYLDWTHGKMYFAQLSGEMWSLGGFALILGQKAWNNASAYSRVNTGIWIVH